MSNRTPLNNVIAYGMAICAVGVAVACPVAAQQTMPLQQEYETAFDLATSGAAFDAAVLLFEAVRELPGDDPALAEALIGPAQLLVFIAASLTDYNDWMRFLNHVVDEDNHVTDQLIASGLRAGMPGQGRRFVGYHGLKTASGDEHQAVKVAALFARAAPYWLANMPQNRNEYHSAVAEMVLRYPNLSLSRHVIEMSVWRTAKEAAMSGERDVHLFQDVLYAGGREEPILAVSPGLQAIKQALPSLNIKDIDDATIAQLADLLNEARDPEVRYALLCLLDRLELTPKWRALLRSALQRLARPMPRTADEALARLMLVHFALEDGNDGLLRAQLAQLMPSKPLPPTPERNLYVEYVWAARQAAGYFTRYGRYGPAKQAHEALANRFPTTRVAQQALEAINAMDTDPVAASLKAIDQHARLERKRKPVFDKEALYNDIIDNTDFSPLRQALLARTRSEQDDERPGGPPSARPGHPARR